MQQVASQSSFLVPVPYPVLWMYIETCGQENVTLSIIPLPRNGLAQLCTLSPHYHCFWLTKNMPVGKSRLERFHDGQIVRNLATNLCKIIGSRNSIVGCSQINLRCQHQSLSRNIEYQRAASLLICDRSACATRDWKNAISKTTVLRGWWSGYSCCKKWHCHVLTCQ